MEPNKLLEVLKPMSVNRIAMNPRHKFEVCCRLHERINVEVRMNRLEGSARALVRHLSVSAQVILIRLLGE